LKSYLVNILFLFLTLSLYSQEDKNIYDFFGGKLSDKKTVFYRLVFQINHNKISGYSFTDERGPKETKSVIQGTFNPKTKVISFRESKKLTTRANNYFSEKCYVNGVIKLEINPNISKIEGVFTETTPMDKKCDQGEIRLISPDKFKYPKDDIVVEKETVIKQDKVILPTFNSDKKTTLKTDEELTIFWNSDSVKLDVWDDEKEDNDQISIAFNDKKIIENYALKNKKKTIEIPVTKTENILTITALNTGLIGGNTARIDFIDDTIVHQIISQLEIHKSVTIHIIKNQ